MLDWIKWKLTCNSCGYKFLAITPLEDYDMYKKCSYCGSENVKKEMEK